MTGHWQAPKSLLCQRTHKRSSTFEPKLKSSVKWLWLDSPKLRLFQKSCIPLENLDPNLVNDGSAKCYVCYRVWVPHTFPFHVFTSLTCLYNTTKWNPYSAVINSYPNPRRVENQSVQVRFCVWEDCFRLCPCIYHLIICCSSASLTDNSFWSWVLWSIST